MAHSDTSLKSLAWASLKISAVMFLIKLLIAFTSNGITRTLGRWYVEAGFFILMFFLMFLALVFISYIDKKQSEKEKGPS